MLKVGVIFGGESVEHEVSIITAVQAMEFLDKNKYSIVPIYIGKDRNWYTGDCLKSMDTYKDLSLIPSMTKEVTLTRKDNEFVLQKKNGLFKGIYTNIDIAFPIVHGKGVEDGSLAGYLETIGIPFVGPNTISAAIGQDKIIQKEVMKSAGVNVVDYIWFYDFEYKENEEEILKRIKKLGYPVIVKPARLGSSVGIEISKAEKDIKRIVEEAIKYDEKIIVEKVVENLQEVDCAVVGSPSEMECSLIGEMFTDNDFLTFEDKYIGEGGKGGKKGPAKSSGKLSLSTLKIPADVSKEVEEKIYDYSKKAFHALNLSGVTRFDFLVNKKTKEVYVNEPNTIPGSLSFFFFTPKGKKYPKLLDEMITTAIKEYKNHSRKTTSFESNVLSTYDGSKGCKGKM